MRDMVWNTRTMIGAAAAGIGGATVIAGLIYRMSVKNEAGRVPLYEQSVQARTGELGDARTALEAARPHDPTGISQEEALSIARKRFGPGSFMTAGTSAGDTAQIGVAEVLGELSHSPNQAAAVAAAHSAGRATAVGQVVDWYAPLVLDDALAPREHTRQVSYQDTEYRYDYGYNPANGKYEYFYGPHTVTKWRTEHYVTPFDRFTPDDFGIGQAKTGAGNLMSNLGTAEEQTVAVAERELDQARNRLEHAQHAVAKQGTAGTTAFVVGGLGLATGVALLGWQLLRH